MQIKIPARELQDELQRFVEAINECAESLQTSSNDDIREEALRKNLLYVSSCLEIATGPSAAVNLLDMFVFVHLSRRVLERHWIPTLYGDSGGA